MRSILIFIVTFTLTCMFWSVVYAEGSSIYILEWDDVYIIMNEDNEVRIDCVMDEHLTQDQVGFCNTIESTYMYCDQECTLDTRMQDVQ